MGLRGRNDHQVRPSAMLISRLGRIGVSPFRGSGAPISIHFAKSAMISSESFPEGGISNPSNFRAFSSKLSADLPLTMTAPDSPPSAIPSAESRNSFA